MWLTDLKNSQTELPDLYNYVQMDEKNTKRASEDPREALCIGVCGLNTLISGHHYLLHDE